MNSDIKAELVSSDPSNFISKWVVERVPHIFGGDRELYISWKHYLSKLIEVDSKAIVITGSASFGYSLNPNKNLKAFGDDSDVDVAIISNYHFDLSWHFLRNLGTKILSYNIKEKNSIDDHRRRLIYWGTIATDKIIQLLPFGGQWIKAANSMADKKPTHGRQINFRIYKDFEALRAYQLISLTEIKDKLISSFNA